MLTSECAAPAAIMLNGLDLLGTSIRSGDLSGARTWTRVVTDAWRPLRTHLSKTTTVSQSESVIRARLSTLAGRCNVRRMENAITALSQTNELSEFSEKEIEWLMISVASIAEDLRTIDTNA